MKQNKNHTLYGLTMMSWKIGMHVCVHARMPHAWVSVFCMFCEV